MNFAILGYLINWNTWNNVLKWMNFADEVLHILFFDTILVFLRGKIFFVLSPTFVSRISVMSIWELTLGEMMWHVNDIFIKKYFNESRKQEGEKNPAGSDALLASKKCKYLLWSVVVLCTSSFYKIILKEVPYKKFLVMGCK